MKFVIVLVALFAVALNAAPLGGEPKIVRSDSRVDPDGYSYAWETHEASASEEGQLKNTGEDGTISARGEFSFVAPDGQTYTVQYVADENGFQPSGAHLPA